MKLIFQNFAGAWGLLGVPALILIHCLRVRAKPVVIPAVFLVERREEVASGAKFARWRPSPLFWVQLAAILLLTAILMAPRIVGSDTRREVALVLDGSASMGAFREETQAALRRVSDTLGRDVARTRWVLLSTDLRAAPLYSGEDREAMLAAAARHRPALGAHDFSEAVLAARRTVSGDGRVVLVTDHDFASVPGGAELVAVGRPIDNVGISGAVIDADGRWRAVVTNRSAAPATRTWHVEGAEGQKSAEHRLELAPGGSTTLSAVAPEGVFSVVLSPDLFPGDDRATLVRPVAKPLLWRVALPPETATTFLPVLSGLRAARAVAPAEEPDLILAASTTRDPAVPTRASRILFLDASSDTGKTSLTGCYAPEPHALTDGLSWGLVPAVGAAEFPVRPDDTVLVRAGDRPLILLGRRGEAEELIFNYDPRAVVAGEKLPAVAVLMMRFAERVRAAKDAPEVVLTDVNAPLSKVPGTGEVVVTDAEQRAVTLAPGAVVRAPSLPGVFTVTRGGVEKVRGAALFADGRESDFSKAASAERLLAPEADASRVETTSEVLVTVLLLGVLALLVASWWLVTTRVR